MIFSPRIEFDIDHYPRIRAWDTEVGHDRYLYLHRLVAYAHDLAVTLLENRDIPKAVFIDESSTHFDARTYRREVATQWTPLAKRFAKIGVDFCGNVIHTGKDAHPELKRLSTLSYFKLEKKVVEFYSQ